LLQQLASINISGKLQMPQSLVTDLSTSFAPPDLDALWLLLSLAGWQSYKV
jgi:hypothetical protein